MCFTPVCFKKNSFFLTFAVSQSTRPLCVVLLFAELDAHIDDQNFPARS